MPRFLLALAIILTAPGYGYADYVQQGAQALASALTNNKVPALQKACAGVDLNGTSQLSLVCKAANTNVDGYIMNDNNARVGTSVSVVCGFGCVAGGTGICAGTEVKGSGGDPCTAAVNIGTSAFKSNKAGQNNVTAGNENLDHAEALAGNTPRVAGAAVPGTTTIANTLDPSCARANSTGNVQDRIDCALATDPTMPKFIKSPAFAAEFQKVTGKSLQEVINQNGSTIMSSVAPSALQTAYGALQGKTSFTQFIGSAAKMVGGIMSGLASEEDRSSLVSNVVPASFQGMFPGRWNSGLLASGAPVAGSSATATAVASSNSVSTKAPEVSKKVSDNSTGGAVMLTGVTPEVDRVPASGAEDDPSISIFERVSKRYRLSASRLALLD